MGISQLLVLIAFASTPGLCQTVEEVANSLQVSWTVLENYSPVPERYKASITLRNIGTEAIENGTWSIYLCSIRMMEPDELVGDNIVPKPEGAKIGDSGFTVFHVAGCLFRLQPNDDFSSIQAGNERELPYTGQFWSVSRTDFMPNLYIASPDGTAAPILNTVDHMVNFAAPLTTPKQYKRLEDDLYSPYTTEQRYNRYVADDLGSSPWRVIPTPLSVNLEDDQTVLIDSSWVIYRNTSNSDGSFEASYLAEKLNIGVETSRPPRNYIELIIDAESSTEQPLCEDNEERYSVAIGADRITIQGASAAGVFYGIQTLLAALSEDDMTGEGSIEDCPRFGYRGFMIDVGRHFLPKEEVLRVLDTMAMYKLNIFHFHLTDDEGFRVEIPGIPELTTVGATQCHDLIGDDCILPQLGSPPTRVSTGSGYYSVEDYKEILQYADNLHIQVIPEIDMPGHAYAIIKAMESRNRNGQEPVYNLTDPDDNTLYLSVQYFTDNGINPCLNSTYEFVDVIIDAFIDLHKDIQDLEIFHWGGDEVPGAWLHSPACAELAESDPALPNNFTVKDLIGYFAMRVQELTTAKGLKNFAWEDGLLTNEEEPLDIPNPESTYVNAWSNVWEWGHARLAYEFANSGYQTVISHATHLYFDFPVEPDPEDRGYYWATRFTDTHKTFSFDARDVYNNIDVNVLGHPLEREQICRDYGCPELEKPENIAGIQGQIWCETMRTAENLQGNVYPRILALAERAWHAAAWEGEPESDTKSEAIQRDWEDFANRVGYRELRRLDALGIKYDIRPPAVRVDDDAVQIKTEFPGLLVEISTDWGISWTQYYPGMVVPSSDAIFVTKSADGTRRSRPTKYVAPEPPTPSTTPSSASSVGINIFTLFAIIYSITITQRT